MSADDHGIPLTALLALSAAAAAPRTARAAEPAPLDEEFLEYLSQMEGEQDDWTLFDAEDDQNREIKPAAPPTATGKQAATKPPTKLMTPKPAEVKR